MTQVASRIKKNQKKLGPGELFSLILKNISIIFAHDFNFEKCSESLNISSKISVSSLGALGICISSLVWLKPSDLHKYASFFSLPEPVRFICTSIFV